ncbi:hypothetical protein EAF00_005527 [Botryotinia globosa]|nr:hypothetical protein EAF00_005527 [Botryotinia globosa]
MPPPSPVSTRITSLEKSSDEIPHSLKFVRKDRKVTGGGGANNSGSNAANAADEQMQQMQQMSRQKDRQMQQKAVKQTGSEAVAGGSAALEHSTCIPLNRVPGIFIF